MLRNQVASSLTGTPPCLPKRHPPASCRHKDMPLQVLQSEPRALVLPEIGHEMSCSRPKVSGGDLFSKMDKDGSGGISREEFAQATTCCERFALSTCSGGGPVARLNSAGSKNGNGIGKYGQSICHNAGNLSQASLGTKG